VSSTPSPRANRPPRPSPAISRAGPRSGAPDHPAILLRAAVELKEDELQQAKRSQMPHLPPSRRKTMHEEVELGFTREVAVREARRCLRCELETEDGKKATGRET